MGADPTAGAQAPLGSSVTLTVSNAKEPVPGVVGQDADTGAARLQQSQFAVVERDFATYDKDANGTLSQAEFGAWIGTLRKAAEPTFQPGSPDANKWIGQAFAATDVDKNKTVDKTELTTFLTPKAS